MLLSQLPSVKLCSAFSFARLVLHTPVQNKQYHAGFERRLQSRFLPRFGAGSDLVTALPGVCLSSGVVCAVVRQVKVWDLETRKITRRLRGQDGWIWCLEQFGDNGDLLLTGATDGAVRLWDQRTGEQARVWVSLTPYLNPNHSLDDPLKPAGDRRHRRRRAPLGPAHRRAGT